VIQRKALTNFNLIKTEQNALLKLLSLWGKAADGSKTALKKTAFRKQKNPHRK
jgi:hypothetical protein